MTSPCFFLWFLIYHFFIVIIIVIVCFKTFQALVLVTAYLTYRNIFIGDHMHFFVNFVFIWIMNNRIYFLYVKL